MVRQPDLMIEPYLTVYQGHVTPVHALSTQVWVSEYCIVEQRKLTAELLLMILGYIKVLK